MKKVSGGWGPNLVVTSGFKHGIPEQLMVCSLVLLFSEDNLLGVPYLEALGRAIAILNAKL